MVRKAFFPILALVCVAVAAWLTLGPVDQGAPRAPARFVEVLRVGFAHEPPYAFYTAEGAVAGEAPLAATYAAARLGVKSVRFVLMGFGSLIDELEAGHIDVIAAGMFVTPERAARIRFSMPTVRAGPGLLVRAGNPAGLFSYEDAAAAPGARVAVLDGAVEGGLLRTLGMPEARLYVCQDVETALSALRHGRVEGVALTAPTVRWLALQSDGAFAAAAPFRTPEAARPGLCALGFRQADGDLAEAFDAVLQDYVGGPEHLGAIAPLGFGPDDAVRPAT